MLKNRITLTLVALLSLIASCDPQRMAAERGLGRKLSIAAGNIGGVYYIYGGGIAKLVGQYLEGVDATAEATSGSIDNLKLLDAGKADLGFTIADSLDEARRGVGAFAATGPARVSAIAVLYRNYTHLVTVASSGITSVEGLRGKVVSTGAAGSGTELVADRILTASGLDPARDVTRQSLGVGPSVEALRDGKIDAFFWSAGLPTAALLDLANSRGLEMRLLSTDSTLAALQQKYGASTYERLVIPAGTYPGVSSDVAVIGAATVLAASDALDEELAYRITKLLFEKQSELAAIHPEAAKLSLELAVGNTPAPFHPGAIRYYEERGAWKKSEK